MSKRPTDNVSNQMNYDVNSMAEYSEQQLRDIINSERLEAASRLGAWLAHKINNPLGTISGNAQLLSRRLERDISDPDALAAYRKYIDAMQAQIERCVSITAEILEFTRETELGQFRVSIEQVVQDAVDLAMYNRPPVDVKIEPSAEVTEIRTDPRLLMKVLYELISNALAAPSENPGVVITIEGSDEIVKIKIVDSGSGIPDEVLPRVFDPFFSTKEKAKGLGLTAGLAIANQLGGTVEISSTGPEGTVVEVMLPVEGVLS